MLHTLLLLALSAVVIFGSYFVTLVPPIAWLVPKTKSTAFVDRIRTLLFYCAAVAVFVGGALILHKIWGSWLVMLSVLILIVL